MASKNSSQRNQPLIRGGIMERTLQQGLDFNEPIVGNPENEEAEVFAANILTEPSVEASRSLKTPLLKRKMASGEGPKRKPKKSKATEAAFGMSLQWAEFVRITEEFEQEKSSIGEFMRRIREERESALAEKEKDILRCNDLIRRQEKLISDHTA
ncbi:hypothetical protein LIER_23384 [Lithospermum erythrorhizon]|uniref:Uncharacterized protein n=1 Tax=Lithospermum erythrorhizon TaxID=34254 RepID=A0AAV3R2X4_LITER